MTDHPAGSWEAELERVNRALRVVTTTNRSLHQADDFVTWLNNVCRTAVNVGGYRMATVLFAGQDKNKTLQMVASAGHTDGYFDAIALTWEDEPRGRGPAGAAVRTGQPQICRDIARDPEFQLWREQALKRGYRSSISMPLTSEGRTFGVLGLYADVVNAFGPNEVEVTRELADDLAFGLTVVLRARAQRHLVAEALRETNQALEAKNIALREVLASIESEQGKAVQTITVNLQRLVLPQLHALRRGLNRGQQRRVEQIERSLNEVTSPFIDAVSRAVKNLTPTELRVSNFIKQGLAVKEVAELEHVSPQTVAAHRRSIRRKLGIANRKINLASHLRNVGMEPSSGQG